MKLSILAALIALALPGVARAAAAAAPAPSGAPATPPAVATSTAAPLSPSSIYTAERLRDPFAPLTQSGGGAGGVSASGKVFSASDFNIHNLSLRGVMKDSAADYALFTDNEFGVSFILRRGKLYDGKNKPVRGVTGKLRVKDRWAELETADHDVQIFRLGDEEKD